MGLNPEAGAADNEDKKDDPFDDKDMDDDEN